MNIDYLDMAMEVDDRDAITDYLACGGPLTDKLRAYLVEIRCGNKRRKKKRPIKLSTELRKHEVRAYLHGLERTGIGKTAAVMLDNFVYLPLFWDCYLLGAAFSRLL